MSSWFILLTFITTWAMLFLAHTISTDPILSNSDLIVKPNTFLLFVFLILMGKALIETVHRAVESKELTFVMTQPISPRKVAFGKFLGILLSNLSVVTYSLLLLAVIQVGSFHLVPAKALTITAPFPYDPGANWIGGYGINHFNILDTILLTILASCMGFSYSIFNSLPMKKRVPGILLYSLLLMPIWIVMREIVLLPKYQTLFLSLIILLALLTLWISTGFFKEAWVKQTSGKSSLFFQKRSWGKLKLLEKMFTPRTARLVRKELVINVQKKEIIGNLIAILGLSALLIWGWHRIEGLDDVPEDIADIAMPAIVAVGIYLAVILQCGLIGLGSVGKEGLKFWFLKTQPVHHERIFKAKALAILALSPVTIFGVSLPLPIILGYRPEWLVFFVLMAVSMIFTATGIGLLMGAKFPNFSESMGGMPDVMSMYLLMLLSLVLCGILVLFAGQAMRDDPIKGLLSAIITVEIGFMIMTIGIRGGAFVYHRTEPQV